MELDDIAAIAGLTTSCSDGANTVVFPAEPEAAARGQLPIDASRPDETMTGEEDVTSSGIQEASALSCAANSSASEAASGRVVDEKLNPGDLFAARPGAASAESLEELWGKDVGHAKRAEVWKQVLLGGISLQAKCPEGEYARLCERACTFDSTIRRDVHRTLPQVELFKERGGHGQVMLFRVLRALAIRMSDMGYCQSLNFIVATLIAVYPDEEETVFHCVLALLLRNSLVDLFRPNFPKLGVVIWQFDRVVEGFLPKVHTALQKHGVNAEYYAIQWFLTLFASDLSQEIVRRVWDRFLVAGWQVVVQVGLGLLYTIQEELQNLDSNHALMFLRKFARTGGYDVEELLRLADSFEVSHQMLSAIEAAYDWEGDVQLIAVKDLNTREMHWAVQAVPRVALSSTPSSDAGDSAKVPRAFTRRTSGTTPASSPAKDRDKKSVLPFLIRNLDTGNTTVLKKAWSQYTAEVTAFAQATAGPVQAIPSFGSRPAMPGIAGGSASHRGSADLAERNQRAGDSQALSAATASCQARRDGHDDTSGSFWMQSVQRQAERRLAAHT